MHGTGNDFIVLDAIHQDLTSITPQQWQLLAHRHFGIGADGLMLLRNHADYDFEMIYYNDISVNMILHEGDISPLCRARLQLNIFKMLYGFVCKISEKAV